MTIYRSYKKLIITFIFMMLFFMSRYYIIYVISPLPFRIAIWLIVFLFLISVVFEIQKTKVARSLALRLFPDIPNHIFIYDNGAILDPFENFFIINKEALIICTCHSFMQRKWNEIFKKDSDLVLYST